MKFLCPKSGALKLFRNKPTLSRNAQFISKTARFSIFFVWMVLAITFFLLTATSVRSELIVESSIRYGGWGFTNTRSSTDTEFDNLGLDELTLSLSFPFVRSLYLAAGYRYSTLLESQAFIHLIRTSQKFDLEAGISLGFQNNLPITIAPGVYGKLRARLKEHFMIGLWGNISVFIQPFVSLSSGGADFDQNLFGLSSSFLTEVAILTFSFQNENIYQESLATSKRNEKKLPDQHQNEPGRFLAECLYSLWE